MVDAFYLTIWLAGFCGALALGSVLAEFWDRWRE
jgi:hypothetical protein